jgi:hypothetical protein
MTSVTELASPLLTLLDLIRRARLAQSNEELAFLSVNDTRALTEYRQAVLWLNEGGVRALSGVVQMEANAPYVHWLDRVCAGFSQSKIEITAVSARDLEGPDAQEWAEWLPERGLWLPLFDHSSGKSKPLGGLLLAADDGWRFCKNGRLHGSMPGQRNLNHNHGLCVRWGELSGHGLLIDQTWLTGDARDGD